MSLEYDVIEDVKNVQQDKDDDDDEIGVASENTLQSLRDSAGEMDGNQNHLKSEELRSELDTQLVPNTSNSLDDQSHSHISGLEFLESVRKEEKQRKKEKRKLSKEKINHKMPNLSNSKQMTPTDNFAWRNVPRPFHDRTCSNIGLLMLFLSLILISLGGYTLAKGASLACLGAGLWAGAAAAICGGIASLWTAPANMHGCADSSGATALPVKGINSSASEANLANSLPHPSQSYTSGYTSPYGIATTPGVGKAMAALLVASLVSLALSTLALALTGIGVLRDAHRLASGTTTEAAIWAGSALVFCLVLHCGCCLRAGYYAALTLRIKKCQEKQRLKDLAGERGLYAQQQAWLSCPLAAPSVAASIVGQQFHQQIHQNTLPKQDSTLANRAGLVRMWLGKQGQAHVIPLAGSNSNVPIPQIIMPQMIPGSMQRSSKRQDPSSRMRPPSDPISLPFDYVKNVVGNQSIHSPTYSKSHTVKPDLTYNGLDRAIADSFLKTYHQPEAGDSNTTTDSKLNLNSNL